MSSLTLSAQRFSRLGVGMAGALPLVLPGGYALPLVCLSLGGLYGWIRGELRVSGAPFTLWDRWLMAGFLTLGLAEAINLAVHGVEPRGSLLLLVTLMAAPAFLLLRICRPDPRWWWGGDWPSVAR